MALDYVDIFYHHRPDPETPLEVSMGALDLIARQGKALYLGISNYNQIQAQSAISVLKDLDAACLIHREILHACPMGGGWFAKHAGCGGRGLHCLCADGGLLTDRYINGIPEDSRAASKSVFLKKEQITVRYIDNIGKLNQIALRRGQKLSQMALAWVLRGGRVTSALVGASRPSQIVDSVAALDNTDFSEKELREIDAVLELMK